MGFPPELQPRARMVLHGHFYQPPREDPWTGEIGLQPSAAPFRDWNARIHAECYHPNTFAHMPTEHGDLLVNNFERISFNIGPTLMTWLERERPETYWRILDADRRSLERLGHGNAIAQAYHHTILPLSNQRDIRTQVRWGLGDFRARFGREAEGMWLPETAADARVLDVLIEEGVGFTILAPWQAGAVRGPGDEWRSCSESPIDVRRAYRVTHSDPARGHLAVFFYDGDLARGIAFDNAASSAAALVQAFAARSEHPEDLVHAAVDGETFGHHWRFADLGLAFALFGEAPARGVQTTNYAVYLDEHAPVAEVRLVEGASSWSCAHGVERWRSDCGCSTGSSPGWRQEWRGPLRAALEVVREAADDGFEELGAKVFCDPWQARDDYIDVVTGRRSFDDFFEGAGCGGDPAVARTMMDLQASSMSMFTSCAWFFADVSGIETVQILRYAERTMRLLEALGLSAPRSKFLERLGQARSNLEERGTGADIHAALVAGAPL